MAGELPVLCANTMVFKPVGIAATNSAEAGTPSLFYFCFFFLDSLPHTAAKHRAIRPFPRKAFPSGPEARFRSRCNSFLIILPSHEKNKTGAKKPSPRSRTPSVCEIRDNFFLLRRLGNGLFLCGQHILQKDAVASRRIVYQHVGHGAHQLSVLNNR